MIVTNQGQNCFEPYKKCTSEDMFAKTVVGNIRKHTVYKITLN